nr:MAG TPA: nucelotide kinase [Caudoviricetes sp.]
MFSHYKNIGGYPLESFIYELPFYIGNIIKYAWRAPFKNGIDDTLKLLDYVDMSNRRWVKYTLSDKTILALNEISNRNFYSKESGADRIHRICISSVAEWILKSQGEEESNNEYEERVILSVASLQVSLLHN